MKELAALKLASDALTLGLQAMMTAQKVNEILTRLHAENRAMTDAEWEALDSEALAAFDALRNAVK